MELSMLKKVINSILRFVLCTFTIHSRGDKVQSHKEFHIYSCKRCQVLFCEKKAKYKSTK